MKKNSILIAIIALLTIALVILLIAYINERSWSKEVFSNLEAIDSTERQELVRDEKKSLAVSAVNYQQTLLSRLPEYESLSESNIMDIDFMLAAAANYKALSALTGPGDPISESDANDLVGRYPSGLRNDTEMVYLDFDSIYSAINDLVNTTNLGYDEIGIYAYFGQYGGGSDVARARRHQHTVIIQLAKDTTVMVNGARRDTHTVVKDQLFDLGDLCPPKCPYKEQLKRRSTR